MKILIPALILACQIFAVVRLAQAPIDNGLKFMWILGVVVLPIIGLIIWFFTGPNSPYTNKYGY